MIYLGSERALTQDFNTHVVAEDYSGSHKSIIKINGRGKVTKVVNKFKSHEDSINYNTFLNNQNAWYKNGVYECISITGKKVLMTDMEVGGNQVYIETYDNNTLLTLRICHMDSVLVKENDIIDENTIIGYQGNTGLVLSGKDVSDQTYGSHVHFEVMMNNKYINPRDYASGKIKTTYMAGDNEKNDEVNQIHILVYNINIRENPDEFSKSLGRVYYDEYYDVLDIIEKEKYTWYKIKTSTNIIGYVANKVSDKWLEYITTSIEKCPIYKHIFTCLKDGKYIIKLQKGEKIFLSKK